MNNEEILETILNKINKYFSDPKNEKYMEEELKKPYMAQLQCNCIWCEHNGPKNPDMGTITYCLKYRNEEENKYICEDREWYEF